MTFTSRETYDLWQQLIADEELCEAVLQGTYREAPNRTFSPGELEILAWFHRHPGTRWNIENLRYRAGIETGAVVSIYLPRTLALLTLGIDDWLQDICIEYLRFHRWDALGHLRLTEAERFGRYIREHIALRRRLHENVAPMLELELAAVEVLKRTATIPPAAWTDARRAVETLQDLGGARLERAPTVKLVEQARDIRVAMKADPRDIESLKTPSRPGPVTWLVHVASLRDGHRVKVIGAGVCEVIARCDGNRTANQIASELEQEFDLPASSVLELLRSLLDEGALGVRGA